MSAFSAEDARRLLKPIDSVWTVVVIDPIAVRVLPFLANRPTVTPVRLTVASQAIGILAIAAFGTGNLVAGALLFELRFLLDCMDGKLARLRQQSTRLGAILDSNGDRVLVLATWIAIAWSIDQAWTAVALAATYLLSMSFQDLRDQLYRENGIEKLIDRAARKGVGAWCRRHRIYPTVTSIEVEHCVLFVAALVTAAGLDLLHPALVVATAFFGLQASRFGFASLRAAARADRADKIANQL